MSWADRRRCSATWTRCIPVAFGIGGHDGAEWPVPSTQSQMLHVGVLQLCAPGREDACKIFAGDAMPSRVCGMIGRAAGVTACASPSLTTRLPAPTRLGSPNHNPPRLASVGINRKRCALSLTAIVALQKTLHFSERPLTCIPHVVHGPNAPHLDTPRHAMLIIHATLSCLVLSFCSCQPIVWPHVPT